MQRIKSGDEVVVIAGKNKGSHGKVLKVNLDDDRVLVQGVNIVTKHVKPSRESPQGGIQKREAPIHLSNVMLADPKSGDPTRVRFQTLENGTKVRIAVKSGEQIDK
ncbi:MAG: 50S ribosomal protein L24 [Nannocystis sp.]|jgi:large subunit ribosomal protein L24|nr:50S ribosomal protein L24 [Nannocystis sp.]MBA3547688.1 50S ribosomal protein L24 [Nannocystis sp.]